MSEAATQLGIGRGTAYQAARTGELLTIRLGKRILVPLIALQRLLEAKGIPISDDQERNAAQLAERDTDRYAEAPK